MAGLVHLGRKSRTLANKLTGVVMTTAQAVDIGRKLIQLLSQQQLLYRQLKELAGKQSQLVDGSDPEMLLKVLAGRQRLIDRLALVDRELEPIRDDWRDVSESLPKEQREEAQELLADVQKILGEILASDEADWKSLNQQQQKVAGQIQNASKGQKLNRAYGQSMANSKNRYFDAHSG